MLFKNFLLLFACAMVLSCDGSTEPASASVEGKFVTEEGVAVEGALVRVFAIKPLDTLVTRLRRDYKDVGCDISDATEFDHRFYGTPLAEGKTGADGKFSFENLSGGPFHISLTHPEYSWRYIYRKSGDIGLIKTMPVVVIKGNLSGEIAWDIAGQDYVIAGSVSVTASSLFLKSGVRLRLGNQNKLTVQNSDVEISGQNEIPIYITSDSDSSSKNFATGVNITNSNISIRNVVFSGANSLQLRQDEGLVKEIVCENGVNGIQLLQCDSTLEISNIISRNNVSSGIITEASAAWLKNIIAYSNDQTGAELTQGSKVTVNNSYLHGQDAGLKINSGSFAEVTQCMCISPEDAVSILASHGVINLSNLSGKHALRVQDLPSGGGTTHKVETNNANFIATDYTIAILRAPSDNEFYQSYFSDCMTLTEILNRLPINPDDKVNGKLATRNVISPVFQQIVQAGLIKK